MNRWVYALVACTSMPMFGHVISMSTGVATVDGNRVGYILRMPDYEIASVKDPAGVLFAHIRFSSGFETGRLVDKECHHDVGNATWLCASDYAFSRPVEHLSVECSFYEVTVANHIHVLRAERAGKTDRAILDSAFPSANLTFRPPTAFERAVEQGLAGAVRIWTGAVALLLLFGLAVAARSRLELVAACALFLAAQFVAARTGWQFPPRFAEAVAALALAYLGLETVLFPAAGGRWLMAPVFGVFSGLYFSTFLADSGYLPVFVLTGSALASLSALALFGTAVHFLGKFRRVAAGVLFAGGAAWFLLRMIR